MDPEDEQPPTMEYATPQEESGLSGYEKVATKVGCMPSFLLGDNLISLIGGSIGALLVAGVMVLRTGIGFEAIIGGILGFIGGVFLAGIGLGIKNLVRKK